MNKKELRLYNQEITNQREIIDEVLDQMNLYDLRSTADDMAESGWDMKVKNIKIDNKRNIL